MERAAAIAAAKTPLATLNPEAPLSPPSVVEEEAVGLEPSALTQALELKFDGLSANVTSTH